MKVVCIRDDNFYYFTKDRIYEVFQVRTHSCVINDRGIEIKVGEYPKVHHLYFISLSESREQKLKSIGIE